MTKDQVLTGQPFSLYGIGADLKYNPKTEKLDFVQGEKVIHTSEIIFETDIQGFSFFGRIFGVPQCLTALYSECELKK